LQTPKSHNLSISSYNIKYPQPTKPNRQMVDLLKLSININYNSSAS
jgi:hypothetical protein